MTHSEWAWSVHCAAGTVMGNHAAAWCKYGTDPGMWRFRFLHEMDDLYDFVFPRKP